MNNCLISGELNSRTGGELFMGVAAQGERYLCEICGNQVVVKEVGGGTLVCCGQEMTLINSE